MEREYTYGVARIRALESNLFSDDTISALLQCSNYEECLNFLRDKGWGNGNMEQSLEEMLQQEKAKTRQIVEELAGEDSEIEVLTIGDEFHNLKAAIKQVCTSSEIENVFYDGCKLDTEFLKDCIKQGNYSALPQYMAGAAKEATEMLLQTGSGQLCDIIIDRATFRGNQRIRQKISEQSDKEICRYINYSGRHKNCSALCSDKKGQRVCKKMCCTL